MSDANELRNYRTMFLRLWQFRAVPGSEAEFETAYGPEGSWAQLFRLGPGYMGTQLLRAAASPGEYVTIDQWESGYAWEAFRSAHGEAYEQLDRECERLCRLDARIGEFVTVQDQTIQMSGAEPERGR